MIVSTSILRGGRKDREAERFAKFALVGNPFIPNPVADYVAKQSDARRGKIFCAEAHQKAIADIERKWIGYPIFDDKLRIGFLWAESHELTDKGMGKTAVIFHILDKLNGNYGKDYFEDLKLCAIYVYPGTAWNKLGYICIDAMRRMEEEGLIDEVVRVLRYEILTESNPTIVASFSSAEDLNTLTDDQWLKDKLVDLATLNEKVAGRLISFNVDPDLAHAVAERRFTSYLKSLRSDRQLTLPPQPWDWRLTKAAIRLFFDQCMRILRAGRFDHCYLFIDDIENIVKNLRSSRKLENFTRILGGHLFRDNVFSNTGNMLSIFLTTHAKAGDALSVPWRDAGYDSFAHLHTASPNSVMISRLTENGAVALLKTYVKYFRTPNYEGEDLFPFDLEAARILAEKSKYHPRRIIADAFHVITKAVNDPAVKKISRDFVEAFFEEEIKVEEAEEEIELEEEMGFER